MRVFVFFKNTYYSMSSKGFLFPVPVTTSSSIPLNDWLSNCSSYVDESDFTSKTQGDKSETGLQEDREAQLEELLSDESSDSSVQAVHPRDISHDRKSVEVLSSDSDSLHEVTARQNKSKKHRKHKTEKKKKKKKQHKQKEADLGDKTSKKKRKHDSKSDGDSDTYRYKKHRKDDSQHSSRDSDDSIVYKSHKKRKKQKKHKHKAQWPTFRGRYAKDRYPDLPPAVPGRVFLEDIQNLSSNRPYRTERQGDSGNMAYGGIYSQHLAKRKCLDSLCLGLHREQQIFLSDKKVTGKTPRYYSQSVVSHPKQKAEQVRAKVKQNPLMDYIHLGDLEVTSAEGQEVNPLGIYDKVTELYLQGKGKPETESERVSLDDSNNLGSEETLQMAQYNSRLNDTPHDIDLWLEFVKFQEKAVLVGKHGTDVSINKSHGKSVLEIKMAVIQKAIEKNPSSLKLKLAQLDVGQDLWDSDDLLKEWNSLLFHHANNGPLWLKYLDFRESFSSRFTVSGVLKAYQKALKMLGKVVSGEMKSHPADEQTVYYLLAILRRTCQMLLQSGHGEKSLAIYQAVLEYNLFMPEVLLSSSPEDKKEFFDAFWESSAPRVGEIGALGWDTWIERKGDVELVKPWIQRENEEHIEDEIVKQTNSTWHTWVAMETSRSQRHWLPWRPDPDGQDQEESCEDPDRQVLCDDVTSCLVTLDSEREKFELVRQFLEVLGVDTVSSAGTLNSGSNVKFSNDIFPASTFKVSDLLKQTENCFVVESYRIEDFVCNVTGQVALKFSSDYKQLLYKMLIRYRMERCKKNGSSGMEVKQLKKWIKSLLKEEENRTSVALWEEYAHFESEFSSRDDVYKVLTVTLASQQDSILTSSNCAKKMMLCRVYRACVELQLGIKSLLWTDEFEAPIGSLNKDVAIRVLHSLATGEKLDVTRTLSVSKSLKTKRAFEEFLEKLLAEERTREINAEDALNMEHYGSLLVHWCSCNAYFLYLTEDFQSAQGMYHQVLSSLKQALGKKPELDSMFKTRVRYQYLQYCEGYRNFIALCKYHTDTTAAPLKTLREPLMCALEEFPDSSILLGLYVELESHASISGRVRQYFRTVAPSEGNAIVWLFAVLSEFTRKRKLEEYEAQQQIYSSSLTPVKETGVTHQLRAWFDRAVNHSAARQCVLLWRLYANFEVGQGHMDRAKTVFYRALQQCPGEKTLYMDMVRNFPDQLAELTDLMIERELRVRTPLEELDILREQDVQIESKDPPISTEVGDRLGECDTETTEGVDT